MLLENVWLLIFGLCDQRVAGGDLQKIELKFVAAIGIASILYIGNLNSRREGVSILNGKQNLCDIVYFHNLLVNTCCLCKERGKNIISKYDKYWGSF